MARVSSSEYLRGKLLVCVTPLEIGLGIRRLGQQPWGVLLVSAGVIGYVISFYFPFFVVYVLFLFILYFPTWPGIMLRVSDLPGM